MLLELNKIFFNIWVLKDLIVLHCFKFVDKVFYTILPDIEKRSVIHQKLNTMYFFLILFVHLLISIDKYRLG